MFIYNVITFLCFLLMIVSVVFVLCNVFRKNRAEKITYIRNFKKGKGVLIYLYIIPLFWIGSVYGGTSVFKSFFTALSSGTELIFLKYSVSSISELLNNNYFYNFVIYFGFVLVTLNAFLFIFSFIGQYLWSFFSQLAFKFSKKEKLFILGNNEHSISIYQSEKKRKRCLVDKISNESALDLYKKDVLFSSSSLDESNFKSIITKCLKNVKIKVIINTEKEDKNIELCHFFAKVLKEFSEEQRAKCFKYLRVYVFGDSRYEAIYNEVIDSCYGCLTYVNKYIKIAIDFIEKYPFAKFLNSEHVDYDNSLIKDGVDINVLMIGFGKTNQQVFLTSVANNQFITKKDDEVVLKKVKYFIFDKENAVNNKNLNHNYYRFRNECAASLSKDYLPFPECPAEESYFKLDINDVSFYKSIKNCAKGENKKVNFVVIAFGTDLENIDMAQKLLLKFKEWEIDQTYVFVKVRKKTHNSIIFNAKNCFVFGNENEIVYNLESIIGDSIYKMAHMRKEVYDIEYKLTSSYKNGKVEASLSPKQIEEIKKEANAKWYKKDSQIERESNVYCCLSLRSKLNLMGLDYCKCEDEGQGLSNEEYLNVYAKDDLPNFDYYHCNADGKEIIRYTIDFNQSRRTNMAILEHLRWNSYMISKGMIPASIEQIQNEKNADSFTNGKNYRLRRHGNVTTFDGLITFRKLLAKRDKKADQTVLQAELEKDVIKYDYQILDDAFWLLQKNGFKIIRK